MATKYNAIALNNGLFEIQGLSIIWDKISKISSKPSSGADFYNPYTKIISKLSGSLVYDPVTLEALLIKEIYETQFVPWVRSDSIYDGSLTATHEIGGIKSSLVGVRYFGHEYGEINKLSNDAAKIIMTVTFEGITPANISVTPGGTTGTRRGVDINTPPGNDTIRV